MPRRYRDNEEDDAGGDDEASCDETTPLVSSAAAVNNPHWFRRLMARRSLLPFFLAFAGTLIVMLGLMVVTIPTLSPSQRRIVILMVSDGMGPASLSMARSFMQHTQDLEYSAQLPLDPFLIGTSRTRSYSPFPTPNKITFRGLMRGCRPVYYGFSGGCNGVFLWDQNI